MSVVKNLMVRVGADLTNLKQSMDKANQDIATFGKGVKTAFAGFIVLEAAQRVGQYVQQGVKNAMQIESSMAMLQRSMGSSVKSFQNWAQTQANGFNMSEKNAMQYGATFSMLLSNISKDTGDNMTKTVELLKVAAVVSSKTGRTMEDTLERIRSGFLGNTEAIEDLGIFVNVAMIESTKAFKQFAGDKSWEQLDYKTQQQIRYMAILEQSAKNFGTEMGTTTSAGLAQMNANLENIQTNIGNIFIPLLNQSLPYLESFTKYLATDVPDFWQQFFYTMVGGQGYVKDVDSGMSNLNQTTQQQTQNFIDTNSTLQDYTDKLKNIKSQLKSLAGFDEINQLTTSTDNTESNIKSLKQSKSKSSNLKKQPSIKEPKIPASPFFNKSISPYDVSAKELADRFKNFNFQTGLMTEKENKVLQNFMFDPVKFTETQFGGKIPKSANLPGSDFFNMVIDYRNYVEKINPFKNFFNPSNINPPKIKQETTQKKAVSLEPKVKDNPLLMDVAKNISTQIANKKFSNWRLPKKKLATGGIVNSPTAALIGEAGSELIMPLENTTFTDRVASALGSAVMTAMQMGGGQSSASKEVVLKIDGNTIARAISPYINKESARVGNAMISIS